MKIIRGGHIFDHPEMDDCAVVVTGIVQDGDYLWLWADDRFTRALPYEIGQEVRVYLLVMRKAKP